MTAYTLVRTSTIRDFEDIYEGGADIQSIASRDDLVPLLDSKFGVGNWAQSDAHTWQGAYPGSAVTVKLKVTTAGVVRFLFIEDAQESVVDSICTELGLTSLC